MISPIRDLLKPEEIGWNEKTIKFLKELKEKDPKKYNEYMKQVIQAELNNIKGG